MIICSQNNLIVPVKTFLPLRYVVEPQKQHNLFRWILSRHLVTGLWIPQGSYWYQWIGKGGCSSHLVLYIRPSEFLYLHTIHMYGCMDRYSCYIPFSSQSWLDYYRLTWVNMSPLNNYLHATDPPGCVKYLKKNWQLNFLGIPPDRNSILQKLGGL